MNAFIKGISYYLPSKVISNRELAHNFPEWSAEKVSSKTGIYQRHIAADDETACDMAVKASELFFDEYKINPDHIDFILFCSQSPDYFLPTTACLIQDRLKIPTCCGALDFNLGCSGYVYGLSLAKGLISGKIAKNVLLLTAETYSKFIHPRDKGNRSLFGDGATATLISTEGLAEIGNFSLGTDGSGASNLMVKTGGARHRQPFDDERIDENGHVFSSDHLHMDGSSIFNFTLEAVPKLVQATLQANGKELEMIDCFVFHQANKFMLETIRKLSAIPEEKFVIDLENTANTVSCTIPIALKNAINSGRINEKETVLITGFGVGYSWGGCVLQF